MRPFRLIAGLVGITSAAAAHSATPVSMSPAVRHDLHCFMLYASAVNDAKKAGNDQRREATSLGTMYFFTRLGLEAPNLNVVDGILQEAKVMTDQTFVKETGTRCEAEFTKRGRELTDVGQKLLAAASASNPESSSTKD